MKIFLSLAAYRDPFLPITVTSAYDNAMYKDSLVFAVVEHAYAKEFFDAQAFSFRNQIRHYRMDPIYAYGACAARHLAQTLFNGEDYFFQVDSHTIFEPNWDAQLVAQMENLLMNHQRPVISGYPSFFRMLDPQKLLYGDFNLHRDCLVLSVSQENSFCDGSYLVHIKSEVIKSDTPMVTGFLIGANCFFTVGEVTAEVPYDPFLYFFGEEPSLALRLWTHGYNIFHMNGLPLSTCYERNYRTLHWADPIDKDRSVPWLALERNSQQRLGEIVTGRLQGIYGVGKVRSVQAYADFCGINYLNRTLHPKSYMGGAVFKPYYPELSESATPNFHHPAY